MRARTLDIEAIQSYMKAQTIATLPQLKKLLGTHATMTVYRILKELDYRSSYSHRGKYYTLPEICQFDQDGIWQWDNVWFSVYGNLIETAKVFVQQSNAGLTTAELENQLHVSVKESLLRLFRDKQICRSKIKGIYVYTSRETPNHKNQLLARREQVVIASLGLLPEGVLNSHELKAAIILFFSLLDEQQRRFYAGLEAYKLGHGGDRTMAAFFGMDYHKVSRGRKELLGGQYNSQGMRCKGGGRQCIEKKRLK
jgi:hypothetical protein